MSSTPDARFTLNGTDVKVEGPGEEMGMTSTVCRLPQ
jgi:hypothetical protein